MRGHSNTGRDYQCFQPRRVAHRTNTTHQYRANPLRTSSSKAIAPFSEVPSEAYPRSGQKKSRVALEGGIQAGPTQQRNCNAL
jgi:hypothetical protein